MATEQTKKTQKSYECQKCDFLTCKKTDYNRHILTQKHIINFLTTDVNCKNEKMFCCNYCDKVFSDRSGLWRHNKKCVLKNIDSVNKDIVVNVNDLQNVNEQQKLIDYLMKENSEFKQLMIDQNKHMLDLAHKVGNNNNSNNNNTTNNNNFNLQFFLNDTCKNAMNIMDFVSQLQVGIKDLEETGRLGFAEGISKIFINGLKQMDVSDRPIHCSDFKRETLYIKDKDQWSKENEDKSVLTNAIKHVAHKNLKQIREWTKTHPEYNDSQSKQNDKYLTIVSESMSGSSQEETNKNYTKIIKNIVKETIIDK